eukprot:UN26427
MQPDDANPGGTIHGGETLRLMESTCYVAAARYYSHIMGFVNEDQLDLVTARMECMNFVAPMYIGEICHVTAYVTGTSKHSIEVYVTVYAESIVKRTLRKTNDARFWFVSKSNNKNSTIILPPFEYQNKLDESGFFTSL